LDILKKQCAILSEFYYLHIGMAAGVAVSSLFFAAMH
jgi:hypothetical protein